MHTTHYAYPFQGEFITGKNTRFLNAFALRLPVVNRPRLRREIAAYQVNRSVVCSTQPTGEMDQPVPRAQAEPLFGLRRQQVAEIIEFLDEP